MSGNSITVGKLAKQVGGISLDSLIKQLKLAGVKVDNENDEITENDKQKLLQLLNQKKGEMSLTRRVTTKIQVTAASGKNSTVNVINRRKIYMPSAHKIEEPKVQEEEKAAAESEDNKLAKEVFVAEPVMAVDSTVSEDAVSGKVDDNNQKPSKSKGNAGVSTKKPHSAVKEKEKDSDKRKNKSRPQNEVDFKRSHKKAKDYLQDDINAEVRSRRGKFKHKTTDVNPHAFAKPDQPITYEVTIVESSTVAELAKSMSVKAVEVIKVLMNMGVMATINQILDTDTAILVVEEMGHKAVVAKTNMLEESLAIEHQGELMPRCPVVTVMGHVDHGKTSLLDAIRNTNVTVQESGGITQHIGAYQVETSKGRVTFLDTPGHSAFTAMRARGANCTDIIVLVVAADDGVMPQTIEAIQHAKAAKVPIIVAVNKIDKPESDVERILGELSNYELMPESWGGDTQFVHVSAKEGTGIEDLLDAIVLQAEVMELSAINTGPAQGVVLESRIDKGRGTVTSVLVQSGQLLAGDMVLAGLEYGRVKVINDENGLVKQSAGPSTPIEILGISGIPQAGDVFQVVSNERKAREVALQRQSKSRELKLSRQNASKLQGFMEHIKQGESKSLNIVLKADVQGSIEALSDSLEKLSNDEVKVKVVGKGVGGFNESDVHLCIASEGILIGFNVRADASAKKIARQEGIEVNYFSVIYDAIDSVKQAVVKLTKDVK